MGYPLHRLVIVMIALQVADGNKLTIMDQESDMVNTNKTNDDKDKKEQIRKEAQDKIDKLYKLLESGVNIDLSLENYFQVLNEFVGSSDKEWIRKADKEQKEALFNKLRSEIATNKEYVDRKCLSDSEVISNTSAISGKLLTKNVRDFVEQRKTVLQLHSGIKFKSPRLTQTDVTKEFQSNHQRDQFEKCLSTSGWGTANGITASDTVKGIGGGYGYEHQQRDEHENVSNRFETFFSRIICSIVPTALWEPQKNDVSLSYDVLSSLKCIESLMSVREDLAKTECEKFFREYGSHVYLGSTHLGGIYKIETKFESNEMVDMAVAKHMVQSKHSESVNASFGVLGLFKIGIQHSSHSEEGNVEMTGKSESTESSKLQTTESKVGGPQEVSTLPLWKLGLVANNGTWVVVDGGKYKREDYTPVWELVQRQSQDFKNPDMLIQLLVETWGKISGMTVTGSSHDIEIVQIKAAEARMQKTIQDMEVCVNSEGNVSLYTNVVSDLSSQVLEMQTKIGNTKIWQNAIQNDSSVSNFLKCLIQQDLSRDQKTKVQRSVKKLLQSLENVEFEHRQDIQLWMNKRSVTSTSVFARNKAHNINELIGLVKTFLKPHRVKLSKTSTYVPPDFTLDLERAVASLVDALRKDKDPNQVLHLYSHLIVLKFDVKETSFKETVTLQALSDLSGKLEKSVPRYQKQKSKGAKVLQAWILKELLSCMVHSNSNKALDEDYMQQEIAFSECSTALQASKSANLISDETIKALTELHGDGDIEELITSLGCIVDGKEYANTLQWKYFEKKPAVCYRNNKDAFIRKAFNCTSDVTDKESRPNIPEIVKILDLSDYFPGRLTTEKALTINKKSASQAACIKDLPWLILKQIISGNFKFRENVLEDFKKMNKTSDISDPVQSVSGGNVLDMLDSDSDVEMTDVSNSFDLHPLDVLLVLYVCCDPFLKGLVAQKIFSCQLAIPFIHKDYLSDKSLILSVWPLRSIVTTKADHSEESVVTQNTAIISFIRLGDSGKLSKSRFINEILRDEGETHNTFFHRDCKFGMNKRTISNGMTEISWYLPSDDDKPKHEKKKMPKIENKVREPLTILNLRGDALDYRDETNAILALSRIVVVFVEFDHLKNESHKQLFELLASIHERDTFTILITKMDTDKTVLKATMQHYQSITKMDKSKTYIFSTYDLKQKREYNACEMKESLLRVISDELAKETNATTLETALRNLDGVVCCDEANKNCTHAKQLAESIFLSITNIEDHVSRKDKILPLQGEHFWRNWSNLQKEKYRSGKSLSDQRKDKIWKEMMDLREAQVGQLNCSTDIMAEFIETLIGMIDQNDTTMFFLAWLKRFLDDESRRILPRLRTQLHHAFHKYEDKKIDSHKSHVEGCKSDLTNASLGLEHFYRELGQIYEAFDYGNDNNRNHLSKNTSCLVELLPYLAAKLLLLGQPLELMDGDAANVPQRWIDAVMQALNKAIGDKKVVSISVLGIQSSGKSTLLNTMFGLQLSVSAGRCTRGVFLQLVPICGKNASKWPSYALVIDTEGLRAPELSGKAVTSDNELATLVIGLADIIILNIKGETMGEMENVLQIVVHELLRLKQAYDNLSLCQSVILVHQNVSAKDAASHLEQGNLSIVTNLNKVTKEAASQACMSGIECFKDVIHFNSKKHVKYISDLWLGNPPMAPINPRYCSQASEVVDAIFSDLVDSQHQFLSISDTSIHLRNLWDAILAEDFVFSFCNGLQIKAYNLFENEYLEKKWHLEKVKDEWELKNIIPRLKKCKNEDEIRTCSSQLMNEFKNKIESEEARVHEEMAEYLRRSDFGQQMAEWEESKKQRLSDNVDELKRVVQRKINVMKDHCRSDLKQDSDLDRRRKAIAEMATSIAKSLQGKKPNDREKRRRFNNFWREEINDIKTEIKEEPPDIRNQKIKTDVLSLLESQYRTEKPLLKKELERRPIGTQTIKKLENSLNGYIRDEHISVEGWAIYQFVRKKYDEFKGKESKHLVTAVEVVNLILRDVGRRFERLLQTDVDYDKTQFSTILKDIKGAIAEHNNTDSVQFRFSPALEILVAVQAGNYGCRVFEKLSATYRDKHSILNKLEAYRPIAWQLFDDILSLKTNEIIAANSLCLELKDLLRERIERNVPSDISSKIRMEFGNRKHALMKRVLGELLSKNNFRSLITYITRPETYIEEWLKKLIDETVFGKSYYETLTTGHLTTLINNVKNAVSIITKHKIPGGDIHNWIDSFKEQLKNEHLGMNANAFEQASEYEINDLEDFSSSVQEKLCLVENELTQEFKQHKPDTIVWQGKSPYEVTFESLWGCTAKCPFCKEPCIQSDPDHAKSSNDVHRCIQHRPAGIGGTHYKHTRMLDVFTCSHNLYRDCDFYCGKWCQCSNRPDCENTHSMRKYKKYLPNWEILPTPDNESSKFWAWCMVQNSASLAEHYGYEEPELPESWTSIKKEDALESLDMYN